MQLPGLSDELGSDGSDGKVPNTQGYAIRWCDTKYLIKNVDNNIKIFSIILVFTSKFFILIFCYELYHQLRDHRIHEKTHDWYYVYWATQLAIIVGMGLLIDFSHKNQKNRVAVTIFYASLGVDLVSTVIVTLVLMVMECTKGHQNQNYISHVEDKTTLITTSPSPNESDREPTNTTTVKLSNKIEEQPATEDSRQNNKTKGKDPNIGDDGTVDLVPPPLVLICTCLCQCVCNQSNTRSPETEKTALLDKTKRHMHYCQFFWKLFLNGVSLFTFLAFLSYLTQAVPSIAISYYLSPTTSLI